MDTLFQNVLTASFHGSVVILAVLILRPLLKNTPKKFLCLLWMLAFLRLLMPFEIQSSMSLQPEPETMVPPQQIIARPADILPTPSPVVLAAPEEDTPVRPDTPASEYAEPEQDIQTRPDVISVTPSFDWKEAIPVLWLAVACCFGIYTLISYLGLKRKVRFAVKIPGGWECEGIETAFILGFIRPQIYIPMGMSLKTRSYILSHERTHLEKGDHWFKMIGFIGLALHWFNPLAWLAYILLCKDIELACDERVVQFMEVEERKAYSAALLNCSTNRSHFAACPVAFGEVSVKERIRRVLNYRKPSFWISLLGVAAIVFVAVCLVTSPVEEVEPQEAVVIHSTEPSQAVEESAGETAPAAGGFAATLSESEIAYTCEQALYQLGEQDFYQVNIETAAVSSSQHYGSYTQSNLISKLHGNVMYQEEDGRYTNMGLLYEGKWYAHMGDAWAESSIDGSGNPNYWMDTYNPSGKQITFPEGTGVVDENTVSFAADWTEEGPYGRSCSGIYSFTFLPDGSLQSIGLKYTYVVAEEDGGGEVNYSHLVTVQEGDQEEVQKTMASIAEESMTMEELDLWRIRREQVSEVPSNKTSYDKDFMLGSGQMGWTFMDGEWFFKFGAEDVTDTSLRLVVEYNGQYGNNTVPSGTITAGDTYFIEQLVDDVWVSLPTLKDDFSTIAKKQLGKGSSQSINWKENYGELPGGFYRLGNYYTFTTPGGETDTKVCYAKFRLYDPNMDTLLNQCRDGLKKLLSSDSYHILNTSYLNMVKDNDPEAHYFTTEVWKNGRDYLDENLYYRYSDNSLKINRGMLRRNGTYYDLTWVGNSCRNAVSTWEKVTYPDESNFQIWSWTYEVYDGQIWDITRKGSDIVITEASDFYDDIPYIEKIYSFDKEGNLTALQKVYVYENGDRLVDDAMTVLETEPEEIKAFIAGQDLSKIPTFSWAEEDARFSEGSEGVRSKNFVNTTARTVSGVDAAISIAIKDCTLPAGAGLEPGTNVSKAFYDKDAGMWKVEFTASWDSSIYQAVYITDQGITQKTVTVEQNAE